MGNRFIRAAIHDQTTNGHLTPHMIETYKTLSENKVATIITGFTLVSKVEHSYPLFALYDDSFLEDHKQLVNLVHQNKANLILQLVYVGSYKMGPSDLVPLAPSAVLNLNTKIMPSEITLNQIKEIQHDFAMAAKRAKAAGYDGVEIHAAHGFLLSQFMTPYYNRRTDEYGGTKENRCRMTIETYKAMREATSKDFPIFIKINVTDGIEGGVEFADVLYLCQELDRLGIDAIETSGSWRLKPANASMFFKDEATKIAKLIKAPIILTGANVDFQEISDTLKQTNIAYFGIARGLMQNPKLLLDFEKEEQANVRFQNIMGKSPTKSLK
jgi:2,4-dienoyl-CoA reductase-like NADH-dependent reductase (Old Yellow Enzyme family)